MNDKGVIHYYNGTDALYTLFDNGILEIRNVTVADNYTEYRSEVRSAWDLDQNTYCFSSMKMKVKKCSTAFFWLSI